MNAGRCIASPDVPSQAVLWERIHRGWADRSQSHEPSPLARECATLLPRGSHVLELGCGPGFDAAYLAGQGHRVAATDFSRTVLHEVARAACAGRDVALLAADHSRPLPFRDGAFDAAYARLTLHYFTDVVTRRIFAEIARVLRPAGLLCFLCKSTADPLCGRGQRIERDMYVLDGHARHFFSPAYARECLEPAFELLDLDARPETLYREDSAVVRVLARRRRV
jgi:SAM-dependent methyltransferase